MAKTLGRRLYVYSDIIIANIITNVNGHDRYLNIRAAIFMFVTCVTCFVNIIAPIRNVSYI